MRVLSLALIGIEFGITLWATYQIGVSWTIRAYSRRYLAIMDSFPRNMTPETAYLHMMEGIMEPVVQQPFLGIVSELPFVCKCQTKEGMRVSPKGKDGKRAEPRMKGIRV